MSSIQLQKASKPTRRIAAERMVEYGAIDSEFTVMEADIGKSTNSYLFGEVYPDRYFQMGIAELNMMSAAAGMAAGGRPVVVCGYGVFLSMRALESVRSMVCYPNLNVKLFASHGGITAAIDGVSHQSTEDISHLGTLPNMRILVPCDTISTQACFDLAMENPGPFYMRYIRDAMYEIYVGKQDFRVGGSNTIKEGSDITIVSYGDLLFQAVEASNELFKMGIDAEIIDAYSVKPIDWVSIKKSIQKTNRLIVLENHQRRNGIGYELAYRAMSEGMVFNFVSMGLDDTFAETGDYPSLLNAYGLSASHVVANAKKMMGEAK